LRTITDVRATRREDVHTLLSPPVPLPAGLSADWEAELPSLRVFKLQSPLVTDEVVRTAARRGRLHMLQVDPLVRVPGMTDPELPEQIELARPRRDDEITDLRLNDCPVTDACLDAVLTLKGLRTLGLDDTRVTPAGLARLAALPNLISLSAQGIALTA